MEKTEKYTLKDLFKNMGSALKQVFISNDDTSIANVELTGDLAKDPIEALKVSLVQDSSDAQAKPKVRTRAKESTIKEPTSRKSKVSQSKGAGAQTRTRNTKSKEPDGR